MCTLRGACHIGCGHLPPGIVDVADKQRSGRAFVNTGHIALQVLPIKVQDRRSLHGKGYRGSTCIIVIPQVQGAVLFEPNLASFQRVLNQCSVYGLGGPVAIVVVSVADGVRSVRSSCQLSSLLPGECIAVVIARGIAYGVISDGAAVVRSQFILPVTVTISIGVGRSGSTSDCCSCLVGVGLCAGEVPAKIIAVDDGLVQILVVFPDQLI